jgi:hypothetical protein
MVNMKMKIKVTNRINKPLKYAQAELFDISTREPDVVRSRTDENGVIDLKSLKGKDYLARIYFKNVIEEKIIANQNDTQDIDVNTIFGIIRKESRVRDSILCGYCRYRYDDYLDRFKCSYCGSSFCTDHRLPEKHDCSGDPKPPQGRLRKQYKGSSVEVRS